MYDDRYMEGAEVTVEEYNGRSWLEVGWYQAL